MLAHIVLFRPKSGLSDDRRTAMMDALTSAARQIPSVRRFHIGTRVKHGPQYELLMRDDFPYAAVIEFDDLAGLQAYLSHGEHQALGSLFYELLEAGLVYDYEMTDLAGS